MVASTLQFNSASCLDSSTHDLMEMKEIHCAYLPNSPCCDSEVDAIQKKCKDVPRGVHFFVDELDRDLVDVIEYEKPPVECYSDLYWSNEDKSDFVRTASAFVTDFREEHANRVRRLELAYRNCAKGKTLFDSKDQSDLRTILKWTRSKARGFEDASTDLFWDTRRRNVDAILKYHAFLLDHDDQGDKFNEKLRKFSEEKSRSTREFAFKIAMGDALSI